MAYLRWGKLTAPRGMGGLGLRDLESLNQALIVKNLWKVISNHDALWVKIVGAKYHPNGTLWHSNRVHSCTALWRGMMTAREDLAPHVKWVLGNGENCAVFSQPWFALWRSVKPTSRAQRQMRLSELVSADTGVWDVSKLMEHLGYFHTMNVLAEYGNIQLQPQIQDKIMFTYAKDGRFTLKKSYQMVHQGKLVSSGVSSLTRDFWDVIWKAEGVPPRVKVFVWKVVHSALPVGAVLHRRMSHINSRCGLCGSATETILHMLFYCQTARVVWFASSLGLRSDNLQGNEAHSVLKDLWQSLDHQQVSYSMCIMWGIWKARCAKIYGGRIQTPGEVLRIIASLMDNVQMGISSSRTRVVLDTSAREVRDMSSDLCCWVDGSYSEPDQGGVAYMIKEGECLVQYGLEPARAFSPLHMKALALLRGM